MLKIAIVGRPNVGKSALFNALVRKRQALVADEAGLTRDRHYGIIESDQCRCLLIDTGGMTFDGSAMEQQVSAQARFAIDEADLMLFCVCVKQGLTSADLQIMNELRHSNKAVWLVANKNDSGDEDIARAEFAEFGVEQCFCTAALRGRGIKALLNALFAYALEQMPEETIRPVAEALDESSDESSDESGRRAVRVAFWGRPNAGKSTLINRMLNDSRLLTSDVSGTTRDSIEVPFAKDGNDFILVDTAGVRKKRVSASAEKLSLLKALEQALISDVIVLVCSADEGVTDQDASLAAQALEAGCALVVAINKSDLMDESNRPQIQRSLDIKLGFLQHFEVLFVSAELGTGLSKMLKAALKAWRSSRVRIGTPECTRLLQQAVAHHQPPLTMGKRIKLRYAHQGGVCPPRIVIYGSRVDRLTRDYRRYLENFFCKELGLVGTPLIFEFRRTENPYHTAG